MNIFGIGSKLKQESPDSSPSDGFSAVQTGSNQTGLVTEIIALANSGIDRREAFVEGLDGIKARYLAMKPRKNRSDQILHILKSINLKLLEFEYKQKHAYLVGRPTNYILDATNNCQLGCPCCIHSFDRKLGKTRFIKMKHGVMTPEIHDRIAKYVSTWAYGAHYHNKSESLLNKHFPDFIRAANKRRVVTRVSTNFAMQHLDMGKIVASGLNYIDVAIDGATQGIYETYRRGGNLELVLENVRALVRARAALESPVPYIRWKYLLFKHNLHEVEEAVELARSVGVDEISFSGGHPGPGIEAAPGFETDRRVMVESNTCFAKDGARTDALSFVANNDDLEGELEEIALAPLSHRLPSLESTGYDPDMDRINGDGHCEWLYTCPAFDGLGHVRSCATPDYSDLGSLVYGDISIDEDECFNSNKYVEARQMTIGRQQLTGADAKTPPGSDIGCRRCHARPSPFCQTSIAAGWHLSVGNAIGDRPAPPDQVKHLVGWSSHSPTL